MVCTLSDVVSPVQPNTMSLFVGGLESSNIVFKKDIFYIGESRETDVVTTGDHLLDMYEG